MASRRGRKLTSTPNKYYFSLFFLGSQFSEKQIFFDYQKNRLSNISIISQDILPAAQIWES